MIAITVIIFITGIGLGWYRQVLTMKTPQFGVLPVYLCLLFNNLSPKVLHWKCHPFLLQV